jgi:hypothetical protein
LSHGATTTTVPAIPAQARGHERYHDPPDHDDG